MMPQSAEGTAGMDQIHDYSSAMSGIDTELDHVQQVRQAHHRYLVRKLVPADDPGLAFYPFAAASRTSHARQITIREKLTRNWLLAGWRNV